MNEAVVWVLLGLIVGGIGGFLLSQRNLDKRYKKRIKDLEEDNRILSEAKAIAVTKREEALDLAGGLRGEVVNSEEETQEAIVARLHAEKPTLKKLASKYWSPENDMPEPDIQDYILKTIGPQDDTPLREPFVISAETWENDYPNSQNESLSFYKEDRVLANDADEAIRNPSDIVGIQVLRLLAESKEDTIYVHDDVHDTNYEIVLLHEQSFKRDVLREGDDDDPDEDDGFDEFPDEDSDEDEE